MYGSRSFPASPHIYRAVVGNCVHWYRLVVLDPALTAVLISSRRAGRVETCLGHHKAGGLPRDKFSLEPRQLMKLV